MGNYITTTTIYIDKTTRINTSTVAPSLLSIYINDAESVINAYLAKQYVVASITVASPKLLQKIAKDLTVCYVLEDQYSKDNHNYNDWIDKKKDNAFSLLEALANDKIRLVADNGTTFAPAININMASNTTDKSLAINVDDSMNWEFSQSLLDDISSNRDLNG